MERNIYNLEKSKGIFSILKLLNIKGTVSSGQLSKLLLKGKSTLSEQLGVLQKAGLIKTTSKGREKKHSIDWQNILSNVKKSVPGATKKDISTAINISLNYENMLRVLEAIKHKNKGGSESKINIFTDEELSDFKLIGAAVSSDFERYVLKLTKENKLLRDENKKLKKKLNLN